jgi:hypothetical protein
MHLQPTTFRQRLGLLFALVLSLNLLFAGVLAVEAAPAADWRTPARHGRNQAAALPYRYGRAIGPGAVLADEPVLATGEALAAVEEPATVQLVTPAVEPEQPQAPASSELEAFAAGVVDGRAGVLRGVYVPGVLALRVVQQPASVPFSVNLTPGIATQFSAASAYGVTGLLADNVASGVLFYNLAPGQTVSLIYGDGAIRRYTVSGLYSYQALSPTDPYSNFVDLGTGAQLSAMDLFNQMYTGGDKVTFQTCLARDGVMSWGRLFVIATPAS